MQRTETSVSAPTPPGVARAATAPDLSPSLSFLLRASQSRPPAPPTVGDDDAVSGAHDAPVTAIVFGDLQCPFTARAVGTLRAVQSEYGSSVVRLVWKHRPLALHARARPAARAAQAVFVLDGGEAAWRFVDAATRSPSTFDDAQLETWSTQAGASPASYDALVRPVAPELDAKIDADGRLADETGVSGVPVVWIGPQRFEGAQSREVYTTAVDDVLSEAPSP